MDVHRCVHRGETQRGEAQASEGGRPKDAGSAGVSGPARAASYRTEQVEKFVADPAPDAYDKLIDELLASKRYGEKWGRHWLDLTRYGDTAGFEQDPYLLYAWRYRDYVIDSFNNDKPYDRFVKEQIGGDELYPDDPASMTGTGFYTVGPNRDMLYKVEDINRVETLIDWVDTTGSVFLGLSVGCARCHDHKFDPISQRDYMAMQAIFQPAEKRVSSCNTIPRAATIWPRWGGR